MNRQLPSATWYVFIICRNLIKTQFVTRKNNAKQLVRRWRRGTKQYREFLWCKSISSFSNRAIAFHFENCSQTSGMNGLEQVLSHLSVSRRINILWPTFPRKEIPSTTTKGKQTREHFHKFYYGSWLPTFNWYPLAVAFGEILTSWLMVYLSKKFLRPPTSRGKKVMQLSQQSEPFRGQSLGTTCRTKEFEYPGTSSSALSSHSYQ